MEGTSPAAYWQLAHSGCSLPMPHSMRGFPSDTGSPPHDEEGSARKRARLTVAPWAQSAPVSCPSAVSDVHIGSCGGGSSRQGAAPQLPQRLSLTPCSSQLHAALHAPNQARVYPGTSQLPTSFTFPVAQQVVVYSQTPFSALSNQQQLGLSISTSPFYLQQAISGPACGTSQHSCAGMLDFRPSAQQQQKAWQQQNTPSLLPLQSSGASVQSSNTSISLDSTQTATLLVGEQMLMGVQLADCAPASTASVFQRQQQQQLLGQPARARSTSNTSLPTTTTITGCKRPAPEPYQHQYQYIHQLQPAVSARAVTPGTEAGVPVAGLKPSGSSNRLQVTPCNAWPALQQRIPPCAPRLLCRLSPPSLHKCCTVPAASLGLPSITEKPAVFLRSVHSQPMACFHAKPVIPQPMPMDIQEFFTAAMRLLGYVEQSTLHLTLHCWARVELRVALDIHTMSADLRNILLQPADLQRAACLAVLWLAGKCEEPRIRQAKASVVAALLPPSLTGTGAQCLSLLETRILAMLEWSPYKGLHC